MGRLMLAIASCGWLLRRLAFELTTFMIGVQGVHYRGFSGDTPLDMVLFVCDAGLSFQEHATEFLCRECEFEVDRLRELNSRRTCNLLE